MRRFVTIVALLSFAGCGEPEGTGMPEGVSGHMPFELTEEQQQGWAVYEDLCWTCHGMSGRGDGPGAADGSTILPPSFHTLDFARASTESLLRTFRLGVGGNKPDHPHMEAVMASLEPKEFAYALSFIPVLVFPPELPGSALAGKAIFDVRCAGCHGSYGIGDGPDAAGFTEVSPADFTADTLISNRDWDGLFRRVADGGSSLHSETMPPCGDVLTEDEIWDVVSFLATFQEGVVRPPYWLH